MKDQLRSPLSAERDTGAAPPGKAKPALRRRSLARLGDQYRGVRENRRKRAKLPLLGDGPTFWSRLFSAPHIDGYPLIFFYCLVLILPALFLGRPAEIWQGTVAILLSPSQLITDYMAVGGISATLLNSGIVTLLTLAFLFFKRIQLTGPVTAALFTISGFSFFGKNLFNSLPIMLGGYLYAKLRDLPYSRTVLVGLFSTALSPLTSLVAFGLGLPIWAGVILGYCLGILVGLVMPPLATAFLRFHAGFNLYNVGFTAGVVGMFVAGFFRMFGIEVENVSIVIRDRQLILILWVISACLLLIFFGLWCHRGSGDEPLGSLLRQLISKPGQLVTDYVSLYGRGVTTVNMGLMGLVALAYILLVRGRLSGPNLGAILTVIAFSAFGVHIRNATPVMAGVFLAAVANRVPFNNEAAVMAALFGTTLAPIAGHYGPLPGLVAGFLHMAVVLNIGGVHGGVNLYNNGFSGGFVAAVMVTLLEEIRLAKREKHIQSVLVNQDLTAAEAAGVQEKPAGEKDEKD